MEDREYYIFEIKKYGMDHTPDGYDRMCQYMTLQQLKDYADATIGSYRPIDFTYRSPVKEVKPQLTKSELHKRLNDLS